MQEIEIKESKIKSRINGLVTVLLILTVFLCLYVVVQVMGRGYVNIGGFSLFRVVTGSMEPTMPVGTLLVSRQVEMDSVEIGDIICFHAKDSAILGRMMTHRVVDIVQTAGGELLFETRGDANLVSDGYLVNQSIFVGKVVWYAGGENMLTKVFSFFTNKIGFLGCIVFPCLLIAAFILKDCVKNIRAELDHTVDELEKEPEEDLLQLTEAERNEMYERIRAELVEELKQVAEKNQKE